MTKKTKITVALVSVLVIAAAILVLVVVCKDEQLTEKERFIEANTKVTCEILKDPSLSLDLNKSKTLSNKIFAEYDFPVENNEAMLALLDKYESDTEILKAVQEKLSKECEVQE